MEGFRGMQNNMGRNRIEQDAEADLLTVMLFAKIKIGEERRQKGMPTDAGSLAPPFYILDR